MTAVDVDALDKLREALVKLWEDDAGEELPDLPEVTETTTRYADALLPVVDRIAAERAAAELRAAADAIPYSDSEVEAKQILRARADHLDPS